MASFLQKICCYQKNAKLIQKTNRSTVRYEKDARNLGFFFFFGISNALNSTQKHGLPPPRWHTRFHHSMLPPCLFPGRMACQDLPCSSGRDLLLPQGAVPLSSRCHSGRLHGEQRSHSRKCQWRCLYHAWEEKQKAVKHKCLQRTDLRAGKK